LRICETSTGFKKTQGFFKNSANFGQKQKIKAETLDFLKYSGRLTCSVQFIKNRVNRERFSPARKKRQEGRKRKNLTPNIFRIFRKTYGVTLHGRGEER